jgi:hypothetical protein
VSNSGVAAPDFASLRSFGGERGTGISAVDRSNSSGWALKSSKHCADFQASGAMDRNSAASGEPREWPLDASRCDAGFSGARYRSCSNHPSRRLEVTADAAAICGEDQCGEIGNSESGGEVGEGFDQRLTRFEHFLHIASGCRGTGDRGINNV